MSKNYSLNIYHRNVSLSEQQIEKSPGHFYIGLVEGENEKIYGRYPCGNPIISTAKVEQEKEEDTHRILIEPTASLNISQNLPEPKITGKSIPLSKEEFELALKYVLKEKENIEGKYYILEVDDCTDSTQDVYHAAGQPLYFTSAYNHRGTEKLRQLGDKEGVGNVWQ